MASTDDFVVEDVNLLQRSPRVRSVESGSVAELLVDEKDETETEEEEDATLFAWGGGSGDTDEDQDDQADGDSDYESPDEGESDGDSSDVGGIVKIHVRAPSPLSREDKDNSEVVLGDDGLIASSWEEDHEDLDALILDQGEGESDDVRGDAGGVHDEDGDGLEAGGVGHGDEDEEKYDRDAGGVNVEDGDGFDIGGVDPGHADQKDPRSSFYPFPNSETSKLAVLMSSNIASWRGWQLILNTLHSGAFNIANLPRHVNSMKRYLNSLPLAACKKLSVLQTIHRKKKKPKKTTLASFHRQVDPNPLPPIINRIQLKSVNLLSLIEQYCARPDLHDLFAFSWSNNPSFQEFTDSPLHQEYFTFRHLLRTSHNKIQLTVGNFVKLTTDSYCVYRIERFSYQFERPNDEAKAVAVADANAAPSHLGPEHLQLCISCTAFITVKQWKQRFSGAPPADATDSEVIEIKDNYFYQFHPRLVERTVRVLPRAERPPNETRRPNWTTYCNYVFSTETKSFSQYLPSRPLLTPPDVRNGM